MLYKYAVIPEMKYAAVVWWTRTEVAPTWTELSCLQRAACIMITGAMRTTPTKLMEMLPDLLNLSMVVNVAALTAAYRLLRPDQKARKTGHGRIWKKAEKADNKFTMTKHHTTPRYSLDKTYQVIIPTREEWERLARTAENGTGLVHRQIL